MAFLMAATALSGCNDESDAGSLVRDKEADTTWKVKTTQSETSQPTVTEQPEQPEQPEIPEEPSLPDFEDEEVVKQLAMEAMNTIIYKDYDKYIELANTDFLKQFGKDAGVDDEDFAEYLETEYFEECSQEFQELSRYNWSDQILSDIEILESEIYEFEQYKAYSYTFTLNNGRYIEADLECITDGNEYSITIGDVEFLW